MLLLLLLLPCHPLLLLSLLAANCCTESRPPGHLHPPAQRPSSLATVCTYCLVLSATLRPALSCPILHLLPTHPSSPLLHHQLLEPPALQIRSGPSTQLQRQPAPPRNNLSATPVVH